MAYAIREIFYSLQGEGARSGSPAVFIRFAGCNLWTGRERDRAAAACAFCDTDFTGTDGLRGGEYTPDELAACARGLWPEPDNPARPLIILTGGEPLLQLDPPLIAALHALQCEVAVETNGTLQPPHGIDWLCVSPKVPERTIVRRGDELKLVFPQPNCPPEACAGWDFQHFFLQPMDGPQLELNLRAAQAHCLAHPQWRLSVQQQKMTGLQARENVWPGLGPHELSHARSAWLATGSAWPQTK